MKTHKLLPNSVDGDWKKSQDLLDIHNDTPPAGTIHLHELINRLESKAHHYLFLYDNQSLIKNLSMSNETITSSPTNPTNESLEHLKLGARGKDIDDKINILRVTIQNKINDTNRKSHALLPERDYNESHLILTNLNDKILYFNESKENKQKQSQITNVTINERDLGILSNNRTTGLKSNHALTDLASSFILQPNLNIPATLISDTGQPNFKTLVPSTLTQAKNSIISNNQKSLNEDNFHKNKTFLNTSTNKINNSQNNNVNSHPLFILPVNIVQATIVANTTSPPTVTNLYQFPIRREHANTVNTRNTKAPPNFSYFNTSPTTYNIYSYSDTEKVKVQSMENRDIISTKTDKKISPPYMHAVVGSTNHENANNITENGRDTQNKSQNEVKNHKENTLKELVRESRENSKISSHLKNLEALHVDDRIRSFLNPQNSKTKNFELEKMAEQYKKLLEQDKNMQPGVVQKELERYMLQHAMQKLQNHEEELNQIKKNVIGWGRDKIGKTINLPRDFNQSYSDKHKKNLYEQKQPSLVYGQVSENLNKETFNEKTKSQSISNNILDYLITNFDMQHSLRQGNLSNKDNLNKIKHFNSTIKDKTNNAGKNKGTKELSARELNETRQFEFAGNKLNKSLYSKINFLNDEQLEITMKNQAYFVSSTPVIKNAEFEKEYAAINELFEFTDQPISEAPIKFINDMEYTTITSTTASSTTESKAEQESSKNKPKFWNTVKNKVRSWFVKS